MNNIAGYNNNLNGITYSENDLSKVDSVNNSNVKQDKDNKVTASIDSVQINQKNENIINTKKAYDAFNETCDQIGEVEWDGYEQANMSLYFNTIRIDMRDRGISVPDFTLDGKNPENSNYVGFVDKIKDFANSLLKNNEIGDLPSNFFEFCDKYKENLIKNGCK